MARQDVYVAVTNEVIASLEQGTVPWHRPWDSEASLPKSLSTRRPYRGVNAFLLAMRAAASEFTSPWWGTYNQVQTIGGQVRKGAKGTLVVFWKRVERSRSRNDDAEEETQRSGYLLLRHFTVFNADQADGLPPALTDRPERPAFDPIARCEGIIEGYRNGPTTSHGGGRACYSPALDHIQLPDRDAFDSAAEYYSTRFHEMTHSTGHASRLARPDLLEHHHFGDPAYCKEELVAEMGAAMLCGMASIEQVTVRNSAAYLRSWLSVLRGDATLVVKAAAQAQRAADHILGAEFSDTDECE